SSSSCGRRRKRLVVTPARRSRSGAGSHERRLRYEEPRICKERTHVKRITAAGRYPAHHLSNRCHRWGELVVPAGLHGRLCPQSVAPRPVAGWSCPCRRLPGAGPGRPALRGWVLLVQRLEVARPVVSPRCCNPATHCFFSFGVVARCDHAECLDLPWL